MIKWIIALTIASLLGTIYYFIDSNTYVQRAKNSNDTKQRDVHEEPVAMKSYKEIFKEKEKNTFQEIQNEQDLKMIDEESQNIIAEVELHIKANNLILPDMQIAKEDHEKMKELDKELEKLQQELEELSNEA